jgi:hypothetical protein
MKKIVFTLAFLATFNFATAATTGTLTLTGSVPQVLAIAVNADAASSALDLTTTKSDLQVATVDESSNSASGYKILLSSENSGQLVRDGGSEYVAYTAKYDGSAVTLSSTAQNAKVVSSGGVHSDSSTVSISYTGQAATSMIAGSYSDTLTLTIQAN